MQQNELSREMRLNEKLDKEIQQLHTDMEAKMAEIKALNTQGQKAREEQQRLEHQLRDLKVSKAVGCNPSLLFSSVYLYNVISRHKKNIISIQSHIQAK